MMRNLIAAALVLIGVVGNPTNYFGGAFGMPHSERAYVADLYRGIATVLGIDKDKRITDTDKFRQFHVSCLRMAIPADRVGKYDGLSRYIDQTFEDAVGGTEVVAVNEDVRKRLQDACEKIAKKLNGF